MFDVIRSSSDVVVSSLDFNACPNVSWVPPYRNIIKINVDNSFHPLLGASGIGEVFRDHSGSFLMHFTKHVRLTLLFMLKFLRSGKGCSWQQYPGGLVLLLSPSRLIILIWSLGSHIRLVYRGDSRVLSGSLYLALRASSPGPLLIFANLITKPLTFLHVLVHRVRALLILFELFLFF